MISTSGRQRRSYDLHQCQRRQRPRRRDIMGRVRLRHKLPQRLRTSDQLPRVARFHDGRVKITVDFAITIFHLMVLETVIFGFSSDR